MDNTQTLKDTFRVVQIYYSINYSFLSDSSLEYSDFLRSFNSRYDFRIDQNEPDQVTFYQKSDLGNLNRIPLQIEAHQKSLTFEKIKEKPL